MEQFQSLSLSDAHILNVRISLNSVEVDYCDWKEQLHTLVFDNAISCFVLSAYGKALSHGDVETDSDYLRECCAAAEEESSDKFMVFNFVEAWASTKIVRIIAEGVSSRTS